MIQLSSLSNLHRNSNALFDMLLLFSLTIHHLLCIINYIIPNEAKKPLYKSNQTNVISQGLNQSSFLTLIIEHGRTSSLLNSSFRLPFSTTRFSRDSHVTRDDLTKAGFSLATEKPQQRSRHVKVLSCITPVLLYFKIVLSNRNPRRLFALRAAFYWPISIEDSHVTRAMSRTNRVQSSSLAQCRSFLAMRQRDTALRLKLATRRTTTTRLIDAQQNSDRYAEQERQMFRFQNAGALSHVDYTRAPMYPVHPVRRAFAAPRPCSGKASSERPCTVATVKRLTDRHNNRISAKSPKLPVHGFPTSSILSSI